jgi:hypothetical protein
MLGNLKLPKNEPHMVTAFVLNSCKGLVLYIINLGERKKKRAMKKEAVIRIKAGINDVKTVTVISENKVFIKDKVNM